MRPPKPFRSEKSKRRTKTVMNSCQPQWNQSFIYSNIRPPELRSRVLEVTVWDYSRFGSNEFLGEIGIDLHGVNGNGTSGLVEEEPVWHFLNTTAAAAAAQAAHAAAAAALDPVRNFLRYTPCNGYPATHFQRRTTNDYSAMGNMQNVDYAGPHRTTDIRRKFCCCSFASLHQRY